MAVSIPREIYTLGAVQFNTQPLAQLQGQLLAKKAAKEEALNKYFTDLQGKINTAGVRTQDLQSQYGGINQDIEKWKQDWLANKDAISKGGMAQQEHLSKYQEILRKIDQSKGRAKTELELGKMKVEGKYDPDDDDLHVQQNISYSIYDPRSYKQDGVTEYGIGDLSPAIPDFDATKQNQFFSLISKGKEVGEIADTTREPIKETVGGKETGWVIVPVKKQYSRDQIIGMANDAGELVKSLDPSNPRKAADISARKYYSKILNNPKSEEFVRLNAAYDEYFPGKIMDTPEEVAKADAAIKAVEAGQVTTRRVNPEDWKERALFQAFLKSQGTGAGEQFVDYFKEINDLTSAGERRQRGTGAPLSELSAKTQAQLVDFAKKITGRDDINQSNIFVKKMPDGTVHIMDYETNKSITPITEKDVNIQRQVGVPEKREAAKTTTPQVPSKTNTYLIKGKNYTEGELLKMGYTKEQITPFLKKK